MIPIMFKGTQIHIHSSGRGDRGERKRSEGERGRKKKEL
jgi:hypothetical protein